VHVGACCIATLLSAILLSGLVPGPLAAQDLEPRSLTNIPVGMSFVGLTYGYAYGNILLDAAAPVEISDSHIHTLAGAYVRTLDFFGMSAKVAVVAPFAAGDWAGTVNGADSSTTRTGFGDPRVQLSVNFIGAPALTAAQFANYRQKRTVGASVQVIVPIGKYDADKLINLGSNRWAVRTQLGGSRHAGSWILETYARLWLFSDNHDFFGGNKVSQRPLGELTFHVINTLPRRRIWVGLGFGYAHGGRTLLNGADLDTRISTYRFGADVALPVAQSHTFKLSGLTAVRDERGPDFDAITLTYQYRWGPSS
jgi:hypothetical protein